ncbi:DUF397 domain-containing protein [Nonomuraea sp. NPDC049400]|uniref:DUF397 domain-containing protein n=1 Tax=Nonomuraea sp. NPDC049400 TaxID=3364352 RepID=UPI00378BE973
MADTAWRKSSFCNGASTCVEVAPLADGWVGVRDAKEQDGPVLIFSAVEFAAFVAGVKAGEFDEDALRVRSVGSGVDAPGAGCSAPLAGS